MAYGIRFVGGILTLYLFYVWTFICPLTSIDNQTNSLSPINHHFCSLSNNYIKPHFYPIYEEHIAPLWLSMDEKFALVDKYDQSISFAHSVDEKFGINNAIGKFSESACDYLQKLIDYFQDNIAPKLVRALKLFILKARVYWELFKINSQYYSTPIINQLHKLGQSIKSVEFIAKSIDFINDFFIKLATSKNALKLQEKSKFVQQEFKNLIHMEEFNASEIKNNVMQKVKDILGENVFDKEEVDESVEAAEDVTDVDDDGVYDEEYDDEEPETIIVTSTIVVTEGSNAVSTDDPVLGPVLHEINYWEIKVNKSMTSAMNNLQSEMKPILDSIIEEIKPEISQIMQDLQKVNAERYSKMNKKIAAITKDFEEMKESNDTSIETVNRQEIRDDISECSESTQQESKRIQDILTKSHQQVLVSYFKVLQETIDILETTSEGTINNFQNQLNNLINQLEIDDEEEINWKIWKKFHKIKESLFDFRDFLFNSANDYKVDNKGKTVVGLEEWNKYLQNIEAHLNFLVRDNIEYLQIVRARANIAFQMREGLVYDLNKLEEEKAQREQEQEKEVVEEVLVDEQIQEPFKAPEDYEEPVEESEDVEDLDGDDVTEPIQEEDVVIEQDVEESPIEEEIEYIEEEIIDDASIDSSETSIESVEVKSESTPDFGTSSESSDTLVKSDSPEDEDEADDEEEVDSDNHEFTIEVEEVYDEIILEDEPIEDESQDKI